jgi:ribosomal protein S11
MPEEKITKKRKEKKVTPSGRAYIGAGMNNTIITITDP